MEFNRSKTLNNLFYAFLNESQISLIYAYYAKAVKKDGYEPISRYLTEVSEQIKSHAKRFYRLIDTMSCNVNGNFGMHPIGDTLSDLHFLHDQEEMNVKLYIDMASTAKEEGFGEAASIFRLIADVKEEYRNKLSDYISALESDTLYKSKTPIRWRCLKCGHIHEGTEPPEKCPTCLHPRTYFQPDES